MTPQENPTHGGARQEPGEPVPKPLCLTCSGTAWITGKVSPPTWRPCVTCRQAVPDCGRCMDRVRCITADKCVDAGEGPGEDARPVEGQSEPTRGASAGERKESVGADLQTRDTALEVAMKALIELRSWTGHRESPLSHGRVVDVDRVHEVCDEALATIQERR